jgi:hypothetical protein
MTTHDHLNELRAHLTEVCDAYEKSAPEVARWANDLFIRINDNADAVVLSEILFAARLREDGEWMHPNYAQNGLYHLMHRLGRDVSLMADY